MIKVKSCKGQHKAHGYPGCGKDVNVEDRTYGLCKVCFWDWMQTSESGKIHYQTSFLKKVDKVSKKRKKEKDKEVRESLTDYKSKLQDKVNQIVRIIDNGLPCLARGYHANQIHAGHVYSRGSNSSIRYNLHNIHRQSAQSNWTQNDDGLLREGLSKEYGLEYFDFVSQLRQTPVLKNSNIEYKEFFKQASKIYNRIKKDGERFITEADRIQARNEINLELNIYDKKFCCYES